ncbi:unnamed protein product [Umbelopsis vinacea]|jgi:hypothetical protein
MASNNRRFDSQLSDIQFRLSGITRPLDLFLHQTLQQEQISTSDTIETINVLHALLSDTASHITQLRMDNMFRGIGINGQAPRLASNSPAPLVDPKAMLDHINLTKSVLTDW